MNMIDTLLIAIVMITDTTSVKNKFQAVSRDIAIEMKIKQIVYEKSKEQNRIFWFPLNVFTKKEE